MDHIFTSHQEKTQPHNLSIRSSVNLRLESLKNPHATAGISISRWHLCHTAGSLCPLHHLTKMKQFKEDRKPLRYWLIKFQATATDTFVNLLKIEVGEEQKQRRNKLSCWSVASNHKPLAAVCLQELRPLARLLNMDICESKKVRRNHLLKVY